MKNLKKLSVFAIMISLGVSVIVGCSKKDNDSAASIQNATELKLDPQGAYVENPDGSFQRLDMGSVQYGQEPTFKSNGNSHVNAHYSHQPFGFFTSTTVQFSATENNQGVSGSGHIFRTYGENGEFSMQIMMDADCLESNGQEAVFVGIVTEILGDNTIYSVGSRVWIRVKDNGQGANAPLSQHRGFIFNPSATIPCDFFGLNSIFWVFNGPYQDVANASDNINVQ